LAACFIDKRDPDLIEHSVETLLRQRVMGLAMGGACPRAGEAGPGGGPQRSRSVAPRSGDGAVGGQARSGAPGLPGGGRQVDAEPLGAVGRGGHALPQDRPRCRGDRAVARRSLLRTSREAPDEIILDFDATDDPLHGEQEGRFFHGYYDCYCYLPLYVFCGRDLLVAKLRPANLDASAGAREVAERIVALIRARWPSSRIVLRADSGFAREALMGWCEASGVDYVFGLARNARLLGEIAAELAEAKAQAEASGAPARRFKDFPWTTLDSWSRERRVVAKAEWLGTKANPRFVVTSLAAERAGPRQLYEDIYCARGDMENRIKEAQGDLFGDRTSSRALRANQLRLWFASLAYVLLAALRRLALAGTVLAMASCQSLRLKLLKIGATVRLSTRRIKLAMAQGFPLKETFAIAHGRLAAAIRA
jgi:hypothetical protein